MQQTNNSFWASHLSLTPPTLFPKLDNPSTSPSRPQSAKVDLTAETVSALSSTSPDQIPVLLRGAWALVLRAYTGQDGVVFGYGEAEGEEMRRWCGRVEIDERKNLKALVEEVSKEYYSSKNHAGEWDGKFEVREGQKLWNTSLLVRNESAVRRGSGPFLPGIGGPAVEENSIRIQAKVRNGALAIFLEWPSAFLARPHALNIASTFSQALADLLTLAPSTTISTLSLLSSKHLHQIRAWNASEPEKIDKTIHQVIRENAAKTADAEAVCAWDGSMTFSELLGTAQKLAGKLIELGVGPEVFVPLAFDKSIFNIVSMLAVLEAGGAFVSLDPSHPHERLSTLTKKIGAEVILCSRGHEEKLAGVARTIIAVDTSALAEMSPSISNTNDIPLRSSPSNAAYLVFTSGTTGEPKGTIIEHASYVSGAAEHAPAQRTDASSRVLQFAAHTFDASIVETLTTLLVGGCICIPSEEDRLNNITGAINQLRVNLAILTPSFIEFVKPEQVPSLKSLILAGEAMSRSHVATWSKKVNLINGYGPSECSVVAVCNSTVTAETEPANIGSRVADRLWVVDRYDHNRLLPIGCVGELLIEGPTVSRGYLNDPVRTAEAFITDPTWRKELYPTSESVRMYKTGDLVRYCADGTFMFMGRKDTQVKFHGQRIELGEIEHHLNVDAEIKHALVVLPKVGYAARRLVAVVSLDRQVGEVLDIVDGEKKIEADGVVAEVRDRLREKLPAYMVPGMWAIVGSLPLLPSGKLDRKRIAQWVDQLSESAYTRTANTTQTTESDNSAPSEPTTETETILRELWSRVLNLPTSQVGLNHSFLNLGGDSISAIQLMSFAQKRGLGITVQDILRCKSIADLARCVKEVNTSVNYEEAVEEVFELSPIQSLYWGVPRGKGHFNQSFFLRVTRKVADKDIKNAVERVVERHSMLRARFSKNEATGRWEQRVTKDVAGSLRFNVYSCTREQADLHIAESQASLDAEHGPFFAADVFNLPTGEQLLFMTGHHLVIDLVSWRIILQNIEDLLSGAELTDTPLPFQTWAKLQKEHAQSLKLDRVLPVTSTPPADLTYWGMSTNPNIYGDVLGSGFEIDAHTTALLLRDIHTTFNTEIYDLLVAILLHSFRQTFTERAAPSITGEGHGREPWDASIDLSKTVGWFTTMYPIFPELPSNATLAETLIRVKDYRRRVPANGRPYFAARYLNPEGVERFGKDWPMEIGFNYLGQYQQLERDDALLTPVEEMAGEFRGAGGTSDVGFDTPRFGLFEISAVVAAGKLRFAFTWNKGMKHQARINSWIKAVEGNIYECVRAVQALSPRKTLADFPLLEMGYEGLEKIEKLEDVEDVYPLSPMQQGLLLSTTKDTGFYAVQQIVELVTALPLSKARLAEAWKQVVVRHPILRTIFIESLGSGEGLYEQLVLRSAEPEILFSEQATDSAAISHLENQTPCTYESSKKPPHRLSITHSKATGKLFAKLEISHAIMDGASMSILFRDLGLAYAGKLALGPGPKYSSYLEFLQSQDLDASLHFWRTYLRGAEPCHFPVLNNGFPGPRKLKSKRIEFAGIARLQAVCDTLGVTLSNALHAAWALVLKAYISTDDISFGYLTSGRDDSIPDVEDALGPFINMIVCRVVMSEDASIQDIISTIQKDYLDALPHRHTSLASVQHALKLSGTALFNTCLSYRRLPPTSAVKPEVEFRDVFPAYDPTEYNVSINIEATETSAAIDLDYWLDVMNDKQAENVAETFLQTLENIIEAYGQPLKKLDTLAQSHKAIIAEWNSEIPAPVEKCVHEMFEGMVEIYPESKAIISWDREFSYSELNAHADKLAHYLTSLGVGPDTFVPTCFNKSAWTIVAMLAILKAGGACVPLDPAHPHDALETRVVDSGAFVVLAGPEHAERLEDMVTYVVPVYPELFDALPSVSGPACEDVNPSHPAVIIYTSGSTGKPKGVLLHHLGLASSIEAHGPLLSLGPGARMLQFAAYTFDNSLEEILTPLCRGATVCVPSDHERFNDLAGAINRMGVTSMDITSTVASMIVPGSIPTVRDLALGGEAATKALVDTWSKQVKLHCAYGPSECSINSTWNHLTGEGDATNIGKAIGCVTWVVDAEDHDRLVPVGCVGELVVEGPIVATGYLNDAEKTGKVFIEAPAWAKHFVPANAAAKRRMYKTGDLVRYNTDGSMTYFGRKDTQVKLNGQRIELGEIEHHLKNVLPESANSAVELATPSGNKALAAFIYLASTASDSEDILLPMTSEIQAYASEIEKSLAAKLPAYYVPTLFIPVSKMPLTTSGKLDRKSLRQLASSLTDSSAAEYRLARKAKVALATEAERVLAGLWEGVLKMEKGSVGREDSFFRLGGDSVAAMRLVTAARKEGVTLDVATIFSKSVLEEMAVAISGSAPVSAPSMTPEMTTPFELIPASEKDETIKEVSTVCGISASDIEDIYPCSALQEGMITLSMRSPGAYVAQNIYRVGAGVDLQRLKKAWEAVLVNEGILRSRVVSLKSGKSVQVVVREEVAWKTDSALERVSEDVKKMPAENGGRLYDFTIVGEGSTECYLIYTLHHALYDGWSIPIVLDKVHAAYNSIPAPTTAPYSSFIKFLTSITPEAAETYWTNNLSELEALQFPTIQQNGTYKPSSIKIKETTTTLLRKGGSEITVSSLIRAAWAVLLAVYTTTDDVVFGETLTGRDVPVAGVEDMVGPTLATVPMRVRIERGKSIKAFLSAVQKEAAEARGFQHVGLQNIRKLGADCKTACEFQNLLVVNSSVEGEEEDASVMELVNGGKVGTEFYTYPLMMMCDIVGGKVKVEAHFDKEVMGEWMVQRMLNQFPHVLSRLNELQDSSAILLGELDLVSNEDWALLKGCNSHTVTTVNNTIHGSISTIAKTIPSQEAICSWDGTLTYSELDTLSDKLAAYLLTLGVTSTTFVPLMFEKSAYAHVAQLAVMKAGGAFVPLDANHPLGRLQELAKDVNAELVLCSGIHHETASKVARRALPVTAKTLARLHTPKGALPRVEPTDSAYIIFTSGTTGKPKGTVVAHSAFCSNVRDHGPAMYQDKVRALQFASYTFDSSLIESFSILMQSGTIIVPSEKERLESIPEVIRTKHVNWACLTPSFVNMISPSDVPSLKTLVLAGEAMGVSHMRTWGPHCCLINGYGPSECAVAAVINSNVTEATGPYNIGRAVASHIWIADKDNHNRLVPVGTAGEILVEGPTLAKGYLNDEAKTAAAFITGVKWAKDEKRRFYKTGDLGRYNPDGTLSFIGRKDTQVKLHGQRMELGEVEHHLNTDPAIRLAQAAVVKEGVCKGRLVAVLALQEGSQLGKVEELVLTSKDTASAQLPGIRERLASKLPRYMIPSKWIFTTGLPLMPSGKLNRRLVQTWVEGMSEEEFLAVSEFEKAGAEEEVQLPTGSVEGRLRDVWAQVLNLPVAQVGLGMSFMHLGGDSISAMQVMSRCRAEDIGVSVADILGARSIRHLATMVSVTETVTYEEETEVAFELSPIQRMFLENGRETWFNQATVLKISKSFEEERIMGALEKLVERHPMLRARFEERDGRWTQKISSEIAYAFSFEKHTVSSSTDKAINTTIASTQASLDIKHGPVFATELFTTASGEQIFALIVHHLSVDVVSWTILLQELEEYLLTGAIKAPMGMPFSTWTKMQAEHASGLKVEDVLPAEASSIAPADYNYWEMASKPNTYGDIVTTSFTLDESVSSALLSSANANLKTETIDIFLASLLASFSRVFTDRPAPTVFAETHGREPWASNIDLSRTVGWFTAMQPIFSTSPAGDIVAVVRDVKDLRKRTPGKGRPYFASRFHNDECAAAFAHHAPLEIAFNYLGQTISQVREDALLQPLPTGFGSDSDIGKDTRRFALFEVSAGVEQGKIVFSFSWPRASKRQFAVKRWVRECAKVLREAAELLPKAEIVPSIADFPLAGMDREGLEKLVAKLDSFGVKMGDVEDIFPVSPMQAGLLLSQMRNADLYNYNSIIEISARGGKAVDTDRLVSAWKTLVQRHQSLRAIFVDGVGKEGSFDQVILKTHSPRIETLECAESEVDSILARPGDVNPKEGRPPHRFTLLKANKGKVIVKMDINHAIMDGSSMPLLLRDLALAYDEKISSSEPGPLLSDFISYISTIGKVENLAYWTSYLNDIEPCLFPTITESFPAAGERKLHCLETQISKFAELQAYCTANGRTLSNVFQLVWALVLKWYTHSEEVCFGYVASGRDIHVPGVAETVGALINMLISRISLPGSTSLASALEKVHGDFIQCMGRQNVGLAEVQSSLGMGGVNLFNTAFTFQKRRGEEKGEEMGLEFEVREAYDPSEYAVCVNVEAEEHGVGVAFSFWDDIVSVEQAGLLSATFEQILESIISLPPSSPLSAIQTLAASSKAQIETWNSQLPPTVSTTLPPIIEQHTLLLPDTHQAVHSWDGSLTYTDLDQLSNRLACYLETLGVQPGSYVPLMFGKTKFNIITMLAILKAGGAFVALDPKHPTSRHSLVVENIGAGFVLAGKEHEEVAKGTSEECIVVDSIFLESLSEFDDALPEAQPEPEDPAYVIYTSGTTGTPKGTVITHGNVATAALAWGKKFNMSSESRVLQFASHTFDAVIIETLCVLLFGGTICIPSDSERLSDVAGAINRYEINWVFLTPSVASTLRPELVPGVRTMCMGGEAMTKREIETWRGVQLFNLYGPTETTVIASISEKISASGELLDEAPYNIGSAVGNRLWVIDPSDHNKLAPLGAIGELLVEGAGVSPGYLKDEERSKQVFISAPAWTKDLNVSFDAQHGMYKTGDLVRQNPNGTLTFVSRKDTQIKLNGQRIELGEIEAHVRAVLPKEFSVAIELVSPAGGKKAIGCFFAEKNGGEESRVVGMEGKFLEVAKSVERSVGKSLPGYMVPSIFIPLSRLPITTSMKLDRRALKAFAEGLSEGEAEVYRLADASSKAAPQGQKEKKLASLWEQVLELKEGAVGREDSFFRLGGDSLGAMRLVTMARGEGVGLSVVDVFQKPVLREMSEVAVFGEEIVEEEVIEPFSLLQGINKMSLLKECAQEAGVKQSEIEDIYPTTALQSGLITLSTRDPGAYVITSTFVLPADLNIAQFKSAWQTVLNEEVILRTRIVHASDERFYQTVLKPEAAKIKWHSAKTLKGVKAADQALPRKNGSELMRFTLVGEKYFVWSIHHALYDGWCFPVILERVQKVYQSGQTGGASPAFGRFIKFLMEKDEKEVDAFWLNKLKDASPQPFPEPVRNVLEHVRENGEVERRVEITRGGEQTLATTIRAAWALLLAAYGLNEDVVFGETLTGRDIPLEGVQDMVGPTLTTVPTRIYVNKESTVAEYLSTVNKLSAEAIPYQQAGIQHIKTLHPDLKMICDFQNLLVVQHQPSDADSSTFWKLHENQQDDANFFSYPLVVEARVGEGSVTFEVHHDKNMISGWEVERLLGQLEKVLHQLNVASGSEMAVRKVGEIELVSEEDKMVLQDWNSKEMPVVEDLTHNLIEGWVHEDPDKVAISSWDGELTYREFDELATRLSKKLVQLGVGPEKFVPICFDKSKWAMVAIYAILKAGGGYVPVDPMHPLSRHQEIIKEVEATVLLASPAYAGRYEDVVEQSIGLDQSFIDSLKTQRFTKKATTAKPENAAYIIFTSGTTGKPKGVVIPHRSFLSSSAGYAPTLRMHRTSRVFQFASHTFDASVMEILTTLTIGGTVCIPSDEDRVNDIVYAIQKAEITWTLLTPSVVSILEPEWVPSIKTLVCGGEPLKKEIIAKWKDTHVELVNAYGPTETSVIATANNTVVRDNDPANIGYASGCGWTWVLDPEDHGRLMPVGAIGELCIEGPTLAREYLHDEVKTSNAFVHTEFLGEKRRLYKTGDLVRQNKEGKILYVGRKDNQVKLHGQRLELGEIEHHFYTNPHVKDGLVLMPKTGLVRVRLVAVLALKELEPQGSAFTTDTLTVVSEKSKLKLVRERMEEVRDAVSSVLPPYMVPSTWVVVERVPMMVSGKLDRKRVQRWLEALDETTYSLIVNVDSDKDVEEFGVVGSGKVEEEEEEGSSESESESESESDEDQDDTPTTANISIADLTQIYASVLNIPLTDIKPSRSFLALGGDSITAMQIMARLRKLGITITMQQILRAKTLTSLLELCMKNCTAGKRVIKEEKEEPFGLSPIQRLYFEKRGGDGRFNQSFSLKVTRHITESKLRSALFKIVSAHSMLRARFSQKGAEITQTTLPASKDVFRFRAFTFHSMNEVVKAVANTQSTLDVFEGPVFAADLFSVRGEQFLFMSAHHAVIDLVSWRVILGDLEECLLDEGHEVEKPLSFQQWVGLQGERARKVGRQVLEVRKPEMEYWGMERRENTYGKVEYAHFTVDKETTVLALSEGTHQAMRTETVDLLAAVLVHAFKRTFNNRSVPTLWTEGHGREPWSSDIDLSRTVGWFTTLCPLHADVESPGKSAVETVRRMKDVRRKIDSNGRPYFAARFETEQGKKEAESHYPMELVFNYLGSFDQLEKSDALLTSADFSTNPTDQALMSDIGPNTTRWALFEVSAVVEKGELKFTVMYNREMRGVEGGVKRWAKEIEGVLRGTVENLGRVGWKGTLSDYPLLAELDYETLRRMANEALPAVGVTDLSTLEEIYPTSPTQQGLLLSQLRNPDLYNFNFTMEVLPSGRNSTVDATRLIMAWQQVVDRHSALRTVFFDSTCRSGKFDQAVLRAPKSGAVWSMCEDWRELGEVAGQQSKKGVKLPHLMVVGSTAEGRVFLRLEMNHAVIDGASTTILFYDLARAYEGTLPKEPAMPYSEYIGYIENSAKDGKDVAYWKTYLEGVQETYFPTLRTDASKEKKELKSIKLSFDNYSALLRICEKQGVTLPNILQAAWALTLRSYTKQEDLVFGYISAGRDAPIDGIQEAVGAFINMLVQRVKFSPSEKVSALFKTINDEFFESLPYQHCSLARVQHELGVGSKALFNTVVSIQNHNMAGDGEEVGLVFEMRGHCDPSEYTVTVNMEVGKGNEGVLLCYWSDVMTEDQAKTLDKNFSGILDSIAQQPSQTVAELAGSFNKPTATTKGAIPAPIPAPTPAPEQALAAAAGMDMSNLEGMLKKVVKDCVHEILDSMFESGKLRRYSSRPSLRRANSNLSHRTTNTTYTTKTEIIERDLPGEDEYESDEDLAKNVEENENTAQELVEKKLISLWSNLLNMAQDSIKQDDSFFRLGGDSIIAMKMVGAARTAGISMTVADLFRYPKLADLAGVVKLMNEVKEKQKRLSTELTQMQERAEKKEREAKREIEERVEREVRAQVEKREAKEKAEREERERKEREEREEKERVREEKRREKERKMKEKEKKEMMKPLPALDTNVQHEATRALDMRTAFSPQIHDQHRDEDYKPFSLLNVQDVDSFLQNAICPKVHVFRGGIEDVYPVTDFQSLAITGALLESRWMLNYFFLDGIGPLDLVNLRASVYHIVQTIDILRTVFVHHGNQYLQVVLRKLIPEFVVQDTEDDLDECTAALQAQDRIQGSFLGESYVRFIVIRKKGTDAHRILMRISHAQYDGVCLPGILVALQAAYEGHPLPPAPPFSNFVRHSAGKVTREHYSYWRNLLEGSSMTSIVRREGPNYNRSSGMTITIKQETSCISLSQHGITHATIVKAAWSLVLAQLSATHDVVFGHVISGRNGAIPSIERIIGPCLNMVPVRIKFQPGWTVLDLLRYVQDQQVNNMPYESLGFREITRHCSSWPDWTNFSTVLQHQNVDRNETLRIGDIEYVMGAAGSQEDLADLSVLSSATAFDKMEVALTFSPNSPIKEPFAKRLLEMMCTFITDFTHSPSRLLPSPTQISSMQSQTLSDSKITSPTLPISPLFPQPLENKLSEALKRAWRQVLRDDSGEVQTIHDSSNFYESGGDIMGIAQVAALLVRDGYKIKVEDLLDYPLLSDQLAILISHNPPPSSFSRNHTRAASSAGGSRLGSRAGTVTSDGTESGSEDGLKRKKSVNEVLRFAVSAFKKKERLARAVEKAIVEEWEREEK